jgi:hypothetical protein
MKSILSAALIAMCVSGAASAATKKPAEKPWAQEPTSFMGVDFKSNVINDVPLCTETFSHLERNLCYMGPPVGGLFWFQGTPVIGTTYNYDLAAQVTDGAIEYFYLKSKSEDFDALSRLFITKYGAPSRRTKDKVKTKGGAEFVNDTLVWNGKTISITLEKYGRDINSSTATLKNNALTAKSAAESEKKTYSDASKL